MRVNQYFKERLPLSVEAVSTYSLHLKFLFHAVFADYFFKTFSTSFAASSQSFSVMCF
jgi:hypothetical protein